MSKMEDRKARLQKLPKDYTFEEAKSLLKSLGFIEMNKGKTSGSRVKFYRSKDGKMINLHKPHPEKEMKSYAVKQLYDFLNEIGDLDE